jgi:hypothetical protein
MSIPAFSIDVFILSPQTFIPLYMINLNFNDCGKGGKSEKSGKSP